MIIEPMLLAQVFGGNALERRIMREAAQRTDQIMGWVNYGLAFAAGTTVGIALHQAYTQTHTKP
jgi:hypothetical protein